MEVKPSIFNHSTKNKRGELLLYNSYHGLKSLCKVSSEQSSLVERWLNGTSFPVPLQGEGLLEQLYRHGFLLKKGREKRTSCGCNICGL